MEFRKRGPNSRGDEIHRTKIIIIIIIIIE